MFFYFCLFCLIRGRSEPAEFYCLKRHKSGSWTGSGSGSVMKVKVKPQVEAEWRNDRRERRRGRESRGGPDLHEEEEEAHISPQVTITSSSSSYSLTLGSARHASTWSRTRTLRPGQDREARRPGTGPAGSAFRLRAPVMLGTVKMEGHEAPDWSGYYSEEVGHRRAPHRRAPRHPHGAGPALHPG